jgi:hypothetical protein
MVVQFQKKPGHADSEASLIDQHTGDRIASGSIAKNTQ